MSKTNTNHKVHNIFLVVLTIYSTIALLLSGNNVIDMNCLIVKIIAYAVFIFYFLKEVWRHKLDLKRKDPEYNFIIESFWNLNFIFEVAILLSLYKHEKSLIILMISCIIVLISFIFRIVQYIRYSKKRFLFVISIVLIFFLGIFNSDLQKIMTLSLNLISIIFGETLLKEKFKEQIEESKVEYNLIESNFKYNLAILNIGGIIALIVTQATEGIKEWEFFRDYLEKNSFNECSYICTESLYMGIIRYLILAIIYIIYYFIFIDYGKSKKIKDKVFNYFIKKWDLLEKKDIAINENKMNSKES